MQEFNEKMCPQCGSEKIKAWQDLTGEQKFLVERLPLSSEFSMEERKGNFWCVRCWNEIVDRRTNLA